VADELVAASGVEVPDKVFFRIGEVADLTGVKAYVLRFWEKEFPSLRPQKGKTGQRRFRRGDILEVARIKTLLWDRKFTIQGAKDELKRRKAAEKAGVGGDEDRVETARRRAPMATLPSVPAVAAAQATQELRAQLKVARKEAAALEARLQTTVTSLEDARAFRARAEGEASRLSSKLEESESDLSALRAAHDQLQEQHSAFSAQYDRIETDLKAARARSPRTSGVDQASLHGELLAVREELIRLRAKLGVRLPTLT